MIVSDWRFNAYRPHTLSKDCWCISDSNRQYSWAICQMMKFLKKAESDDKD